MFHVGQLVVRLPIGAVDAWDRPAENDPTVAGHVYTVSRSWVCPRPFDPFPAIKLAEFPDVAGWAAVYFRPITDDRLQIFRSLLNPTPVDVLNETMREREDELNAAWQTWSA